MRYAIGYVSLPALLLGLAACGDDSAGPSAEDCSGPPEVTVSEAGAEPRQTMELSPTAGDTLALDMNMETTYSARVDGEDVQTAPSPPMTLGMKMTIDDVSGDEIVMSFVYDRAESEGADAAVQDMLKSMEGISGTITTTRSGAFVDGEVDTAGVDPSLEAVISQLEQQMSDLTVPLPTEAVGVGAKWDVVSSVTATGVTFCNTATYELTEFNGDAYKLDVTVDQQAVPGSSEQGGASLKVIEGSGSASGQATGSLKLPMAVSSTSDATSTIKMEVDQNGSKSTQEVEAKVQIELSPRE